MVVMVPPASSADASNESWQAIERLVEELASLAQTDLDAREFYVSLLDRVVRALAAVGGGVWGVDHGAVTGLMASINFPAELAEGDGAAGQQRLVRAALKQDSTQLVPPRLSLADSDSGLENASDWLLMLCPVRYDGRATAVVEVLLEPAASPDLQAGAARLLNVFCELAADYHRCRELQRLRRRDSEVERFDELVQRIHASLDPAETAYCIANDGRYWIGCDRLSVAEMRGRRARVIAVSGVDHVDRRSEQVRRLAQLATAAAAIREPLYWAGRDEQLPPQLAAALELYVDQVHARRLAVVPLGDRRRAKAWPEDGHAIGVLVAEAFDERLDAERFRRRMDDVACHGAAALSKSLEHHRLPLLRLWVALGRFSAQLRRRWAAALLIVGLLAAAIALLAMLPMDFTVAADGSLQPQLRRNLFAPADGVVDQVLVHHGDPVSRGAVLLRLSDDKLDFERTRVAGELQTAQARLAAIRAKRSSGRTSADMRENEQELAADEEQLKQQIAGLLRQQMLLDELRDDLRVVSPIDGRVLSWNVSELLQDRPVRQGQRLLTVADPQGPWVLELRVADDDVGHVLSAREQLRGDLPVSFLLATDPSITYQGRIEKVSQVTDSNDGQAPSAIVTVKLEGTPPPDPRSGAGVVARIHCGLRPVGYIWLHEFIDAVRSRVLF
jgi:multidrug efflux pump subunit AcrA (membrane-fusion protein)